MKTANYFFCLIVIAAGIFLISCESSTSPSHLDANNKVINKINVIGDSITSKIIINGVNKSVPGAIIGVLNSETGLNYLKSFGKADMQTGTQLYRSDEIRIGTMTQSFIATLVLQLVNEGKIGINDPINKYIQVPHSGSIITVGHLLSMRSGIADFTDTVKFYQKSEPFKKWSEIELVTMAFNIKPFKSPDQITELSHTNYLILGMIAEKVTGKQLHELIQTRIIEHLYMPSTQYDRDLKFINSTKYSKGYEFTEGTGPVDYTAKYDYSWSNASANMTSNANDLLIWAESLGVGKLITSNNYKLMTNFKKIENTSNIYYGMGMMRIGKFIGYVGEINGYYTYLFFHPDKKTIIYIFTNMNNNNYDLFAKIANVLYPGINLN